MKRNLLVVIIFSLLSSHAFGQPAVVLDPPVITFIAGGNTLIKYTTDGTTLFNVPTGNPDNILGYGAVNIALYAAPAGTVLHGSGGSPFGVPDLTGPWLSQTSAPIQNVAPLSGHVPAINVTLDTSLGAPGVVVELEAVYWTGNYTTFAQALVSGNSLVAWSGSAASGGAFGWEQATGSLSGPPSGILSGAAAFNGLVNSVPEPSIFALGGLGGTALLFFRRRK